MQFSEIKLAIENTYHKYFPKSLCVVRLMSVISGDNFIDITCLLAANEKELPHGIDRNDCFYNRFTIDLPRGWKESDELPDDMQLEALNNEIKHKPKSEHDYWYCEYTKVSFRKTTGNAEKIIKAMDRYFKRLFDATMEQYEAENLLPDDAALFKNKYTECIVVPFTSAGHIGSITVCDWDVAESTAKQLRRGGRKVQCMTRKKFNELQEREDAERKAQC